ENETIKAIPFEVMFCRKPRTPTSLNLNLDSPSFHQRVINGLKLRDKVKDELSVSQDIQKKYYDRNKKAKTFQVGDTVMIHNPTAKKLEFKWSGPFKIIE